MDKRKNIYCALASKLLLHAYAQNFSENIRSYTVVRYVWVNEKEKPPPPRERKYR